MKLGIIVRADKTGLGNQTRNLVKMLNPERILIIDSTPFNGNEQFFDTFKDVQSITTYGFPDDATVRMFMYKLDAVVTCELFYNPTFVYLANKMGVRTYNQFNYEFLDHLVKPGLALPTMFLAPSYWHLHDMQQQFYGRVKYLPPPTDENQFAEAREVNLKRTGKRRFLHIVGRMAASDRNGTIDLLESLQYTKSNFELVLKVQTMSADLEKYKDPRITIDTSSPEDESELYKDFDAMILPRKYAGLCLPMNEALMSGLPVVMTNIEPNNVVLPQKWLVDTVNTGTIKTRVELPLQTAKHIDLAAKLDWLVSADLRQEKEEAIQIAMQNYSMSVLKDKYLEILQ